LIFSRNLLIAMCATFVAFCTLYTPQPLLPLLASEFSISPGDAGLLMTVTLLPLGIAPVVYGYFLQAIPARLMLSVALFLLMLDQFAFYLASEFWQLILLRSVQGLLLPAIFTALMTYLREHGAKSSNSKNHGLVYWSNHSGRFCRSRDQWLFLQCFRVAKRICGARVYVDNSDHNAALRRHRCKD